MTTLLLLLSFVFAQPAVTASDAWLTESTADGTAEAYLSIRNPTMYDIYVVKANSDVAEKIDFREGDKALKEITVASYGSLELAPGGTFLRLTGLKKPLRPGDAVELVLTTDGGIVLKLSAPVKKP